LNAVGGNITFYCGKCTKRVNTFCGQTEEFLSAGRIVVFTSAAVSVLPVTVNCSQK